MSAFEKGLCWSLYKHMEDDFIRFMEYVPYTANNAKVYSPKLIALLLQICGYIDTVFKEMAKFKEFQNIQECQKINALASKDYYGFDITLAQSAFEKIYNLSSNNGAKLVANLEWFGDKELTPFATFNSKTKVSPSWWEAHQEVKHFWATTIQKANMDNTLEALSGAFLLNAVHYPSIRYLWKLGDLDLVQKTMDGYEIIRIPEGYLDLLLNDAIKKRKPIAYHHILDSRLFAYERM